MWNAYSGPSGPLIPAGSGPVINPAPCSTCDQQEELGVEFKFRKALSEAEVTRYERKKAQFQEEIDHLGKQ